MNILELLNYRLKERKLADAYRECCRGFYEEYEWYKKYVCKSSDDLEKFVPGRHPVVHSRAAVYRYFEDIERMGLKPKNILLKAAREMDSGERRVIVFDGIFDLEDLDFKPASERIARFYRNMGIVNFIHA